MSLQVVGAGLGRTGTASLKMALEELLGGRCHHMFEVLERPEEISIWTAAAGGEMPDWQRFLSDYVALVDWPGASVCGALGTTGARRAVPSNQHQRRVHRTPGRSSATMRARRQP